MKNLRVLLYNCITYGNFASTHRLGIVDCVKIFLLCVMSLSGLSQPISAHLRRYHDFVSVHGGNSLPMTGITALAIDEDGFVWGASRMGIVRATPSGALKYDLPVTTPDVMQMKLVYNKGVLAAGTQNGQVFRYNRIKDRFEQWFSLTDILGKKDWVSNIAIDAEGVVWISTSLGVYTFENGTLSKYLSSANAYSYILPTEGDGMFVIDDGKIYTLSAKTKTPRYMDGGFHQYVSTATYDASTKSVLLGTYQGELWKYDLRNQRLSRISDSTLPEFIIRSIIVGPENILVGMEGKGIVVIDADTEKIIDIIKDDIDNPTSLKGNSVFAMTTDSQGRLWVATTSAGLQYSDTDDETERIVHKYHTTSSLHNNEVNYLFNDRDGNLWVGTSDGISRRDAKDGSWRHLYGGRQMSVISLTQDRQGLMYASTYGNGVYVLDPKTNKELRHFTEKESDIFGKGAYVFASFTDSDGDIWYGGVKGDIICYSPAEGIFRKYESHPVFCFAEQSPGRILTGGGDGLIVIDKRSGKTETLLADNVVQQILVDGNEMWICTSGKGVIHIDGSGEISESLTVNEGLPSNFTRSIIKNGDKLWIGTALGMSCYDMENKTMLRLPGKDVFTADAFRENSSAILSDGHLAFGTNNGIVVFNPDKILANRNQGKIYFSDIRVYGRSIRSEFDRQLTLPIDSLQELILDHPRNSFTLSVLPLGNVGTNVMYSWNLEGVDRDWSELSPVPLINYINLKPGKYNLHVRMYDGGIVSERSLTIVVKPPFWNTLWFKILIIFALIILLTVMARQYLNSLRRRNAFEKLLLSLQMAEDLNRNSRSGLIEMNTIEDVSVEEVGNDDRNETDNVDSNDKETEGTGIVDDEFLTKAIECVKSNISNETFGKGDFASAMGVSQSLLYKKIKAVTDMSVVEFIRSIRLNHAMTLLGSGRYNVTEVSEMCGFSSSSYFSRVFKEGFGKSPSEIIPRM